MRHDELIARLTREIEPVSRHAVERRVLSGVLLGGLVTLFAVRNGLGFRPDLSSAVQGGAFWMKCIYTCSLTAVALAATIRLARPDSQQAGGLWIAFLPVLGLAFMGAIEMAHTPASSWLATWLGHSWKVCSLLVFLLSIPIGAGLLWSFRKLAPTRLRLAGAAAGLTAGAWSATLYCLHCPETSAIFVLTWYTLGIGLAGVAGALLGPRLLRW